MPFFLLFTSPPSLCLVSSLRNLRIVLRTLSPCGDIIYVRTRRTSPGGKSVRPTPKPIRRTGQENEHEKKNSFSFLLRSPPESRLYRLCANANVYKIHFGNHSSLGSAMLAFAFNFNSGPHTMRSCASSELRTQIIHFTSSANPRPPQPIPPARAQIRIPNSADEVCASDVDHIMIIVFCTIFKMLKKEEEEIFLSN